MVKKTHASVFDFVLVLVVVERRRISSLSFPIVQFLSRRYSFGSLCGQRACVCVGEGLLGEKMLPCCRCFFFFNEEVLNNRFLAANIFLYNRSIFYFCGKKLVVAALLKHGVGGQA